MASIISKAFDTTKKVFNTIFNGSPNLFTTDDLNITMKRLNNYLMSLESITGVRTDMVIQAQYSDFSAYDLEVSYKFQNLYAFGCHFTSDNIFRSLAASNRDEQNPGYLVATFKRKKVTFSDDSTHTISGATFDDGTLLQAADYEVLEDPTFSLLASSEIPDSTDDSLVVVLAKFTPNVADEKAVIVCNYVRIGKENSVPLNSTGVLTLSDLRSGKLSTGMSYDNAISRLCSYTQIDANTLNTNWLQTRRYKDDGTKTSSVILVRVVGGMLGIHIPFDIDFSSAHNVFNGAENKSPGVYLSTITDQTIVRLLEQLNGNGLSQDSSYRIGTAGMMMTGDGLVFGDSASEWGERYVQFMPMDLVLKRIPKSVVWAATSPDSEFGIISGFQNEPTEEYFWNLFFVATGGIHINALNRPAASGGSQLAFSAGRWANWPENRVGVCRTHGGLFTFPLMFLGRG